MQIVEFYYVVEFYHVDNSESWVAEDSKVPVFGFPFDKPDVYEPSSFPDIIY